MPDGTSTNGPTGLTTFSSPRPWMTGMLRLSGPSNSRLTVLQHSAFDSTPFRVAAMITTPIGVVRDGSLFIHQNESV